MSSFTKENVMDVLKAGEAFAGAVVSTANSIPFLGVVVSVIGQVEVMRENKTSSESLADLMQTMCISVKNTLLCIKSDEIFMTSNDMTSLKLVGDTVVKASKFIFSFFNKHWFPRYTLAQDYKKALEQFSRNLSMALQGLEMQYKVYSHNALMKQGQAQLVAVAAINDLGDVKQAMTKVEEDAKKNKANLLLMKKIMSNRERKSSSMMDEQASAMQAEREAAEKAMQAKVDAAEQQVKVYEEMKEAVEKSKEEEVQVLKQRLEEAVKKAEALAKEKEGEVEREAKEMEFKLQDAKL
eukprot:CAMPEP_0182496072 /NCGR_PEP_ID=MMETSP1321-20130603/4760_1 /TAXON_ID=91990 /ORGANISM="Bolidomonas sp., Strain RCC1657" /LENGTH=295 /DNA_ID=CAMNT_0024699581 /DNA_START=269 /DNA_END=1152 /DNA_ORIENTATION=+